MTFFAMAKTALKTILKKPATIRYPAEPPKRTPITRGHIVFDGSKCISCSICQRKCPTQALTLDKEAKTWQINRFRCVICNSCVETCPAKCLSTDNRYTAPASAKGVETFHITYVKPVRPEKKETPGS